jgi:hypothetical protein
LRNGSVTIQSWPAGKQGDEYGFIKFGSRVDVLLPLTAKINVELNQVVQRRRYRSGNLVTAVCHFLTPEKRVQFNNSVIFGNIT